MSGERMRSHDETGLVAYFEKHHKRPWGAGIMGLADTAASAGTEIGEALDLAEVSKTAGILRRAYRRGTLSRRFRTAAWKLLRPTTPHWNDLRKLAETVGLDHLPFASFCSRLAEECKETARNHPELAQWVYRRMALLDSVLVRRTKDKNRRGVEFQLRNALDDCRQLDIPAAIEESTTICQEALIGVGNAVLDAIGEAAAFSVNVMVPLRAEQMPDWSANPAALNNQRAANELWRHVGPHEQRLVVLEETRGASHIGFWVPVFPKRPSLRLPGATEAIGGNASLVMKSDLASLEGFAAELHEDWERYMTRVFSNDLFLSLPVKPPNSATAVAVVNINIDTKAGHERDWYRTYHPSWTAQAEDFAWDFLELALRAMTICSRRHVGVQQLDCGVPRYEVGMLPPSAAVMLPAGRENDDEH